MKAYIKPELICRCFQKETVVTESGIDDMTAVETAQMELAGSKYTKVERILIAIW